MPNFPAAVPALPPLQPYTQADFLALFERLLPNHYLAPLKDPGPGYEYLQAIAAMMARVSQAVAHVGTGCYIGSATGGQYATTQVQLYRSQESADLYGEVGLFGENHVPQGTLVGTADGYYYQLMTSVLFADGDPGPHDAVAKAVTRGWLWNRPASFYTADGEFVEGPITQLVRPLFDSVLNFDPTIQVRQTSYNSSVTLLRPTADAGAVRFPIGTPFIADNSTPEGCVLLTLQEIDFGPTDLGPITVELRPADPLKATFSGAPVLSSSVYNPDPSIYVDGYVVGNSFAAINGVAPMLDGLGADRGILRNFAGIRSANVYFNDPPLLDAVLLAGSVFGTSNGFHYETTQNLNIVAGVGGTYTVPVLPLFLNEQANTRPITQLVTAKWLNLPADISAVDSLLPAVESDAAYRIRLTLLPDTVTPTAMRKAVESSLAAILVTTNPPYPFNLRETWDLRYQTAYSERNSELADGDPPDNGANQFPADTTLYYANTSVYVAGGFSSNIFIYDYDAAHGNADALSNRYLSDGVDYGVVIVELPTLVPETLMASRYPGIAANLEQIKPAGATVLYVLGPTV